MDKIAKAVQLSFDMIFSAEIVILGVTLSHTSLGI
jgi:hypothetical protein